ARMTTKENMKEQDDTAKRNAEGQRFIPTDYVRRSFLADTS
ncbi:hypothetical protein SAMN04487770_1321, partial [Butyrivibrio sp. ob235]